MILLIKMKINTITCHHVYNYGASLQAYALQQYLLSLGCESEIINYVPWYHNRYTFWNVNRMSSNYKLINNSLLLKFIWCLKYNLPYIIKEHKRKKAFDSFDEKFLIINKKKYRDIAELRTDPPAADVYMAGSDQIWNTNVTNGLEKAYFLDFGDSTTKKVSYAASFGGDMLPKSEEDHIKELLGAFSIISIREKSGKALLNKIGITDVNLVLDPVFLLSRSQWEDVAQLARNLNHPEKYILLYNFKINAAVNNFVTNLKQFLKIPIVCIHCYDEITYADYTIKSAGPLEFLDLIKNAEVVVSDSFHATVFSIIFKKEFYTFSLSGHSNISRMTDLLDCLEIKNRLNVDGYVRESIDYDSVDPKLQSYIDNSKSFINKVISYSN